EPLVDQLRRHLALAKARHVDLRSALLVGRVEPGPQLLEWHLDGEPDPGRVQGLHGALHSYLISLAALGRRRDRTCRDGVRGRCRHASCRRSYVRFHAGPTVIARDPVAATAAMGGHQRARWPPTPRGGWLSGYGFWLTKSRRLGDPPPRLPTTPLVASAMIRSATCCGVQVG